MGANAPPYPRTRDINQAMARVMSPRDRGACIVNAGAIGACVRGVGGCGGAVLCCFGRWLRYLVRSLAAAGWGEILPCALLLRRVGLTPPPIYVHTHDTNRVVPGADGGAGGAGLAEL